ncbi:MAG: response regulator [Desulfobacterales bacterium]
MINIKQPSQLRILLVEDSVHDQRAIERALKDSEIPFHLDVRERAEDIPAAMQGGSESFDLVVVDFNLPGLNGLAAYKQLQQNSDLPPFVMLTGTGSEYLVIDALKAGMYDYIIKDSKQGYLRLLPLKLMDVKQRHEDRKARLKAKADLKKAHDELEKMVKRRTAELARTVTALERENAERRQTERALRRSERILRALSLKIIETQEKERRLMAKELHDSIGSSLAAIKFAVEGRLQNMPQAPPGTVISLEKIVEHIHDTIREVRRISTSLRPSMLDDLGLIATLRWHCRNSAEMFSDTRIDMRFTVQEDDIPEFSKIVIYRVLQEALNNALKHSHADTVTVNLEKVRGCLRLCVKDDGCGFNPQEVLKNPDSLTGYGLKSMRDRAEVVGGALTLDSSLGRGTSVCLELPCEINLTTCEAPVPNL